MCSDVLRCSQMFSDDHRCFWIFFRYSIDVLLMFSRCSLDVPRMIAGFFQDDHFQWKIQRNSMIPNYLMIPAIQWSPAIRWSTAIRWSPVELHESFWIWEIIPQQIISNNSERPVDALAVKKVTHCTMPLSVALRIWNSWKCQGLLFAQFWSNMHQWSSKWS